MSLQVELLSEEKVTFHRVQRMGFERARGEGDLRRQVSNLMAMSVRGLADMYDVGSGRFPHTMRGVRTSDGPQLRAEGDSLRYAAIVALGLGVMPMIGQERVLAGRNARDLALRVADRAVGDTDAGAVALAAWAAAEVADHFAADLFDDLRHRVVSGQPLPTVDTSWILSAAIAARHLSDTADLASTVAERLLRAAGTSGVFPHMLPFDAQSRIRQHVGCFADQVYPIQALSRWFVVSCDPAALSAAERCAKMIVDLQGDDGQWWWHYDVRNGSVVEGFPVYSVHQHAMGPMALHELYEAGGSNHDEAIALGVRWLQTHPEVIDELIAERLNVVWRKVGRHEQRKIVRGVAALTTAGSPSFHLPLVDRVWPPGRIDYECRPYELGWLLYAWAGNDVIPALTEKSGE